MFQVVANPRITEYFLSSSIGLLLLYLVVGVVGTAVSPSLMITQSCDYLLDLLTYSEAPGPFR
jgi:hypothetical protein